MFTTFKNPLTTGLYQAAKFGDLAKVRELLGFIALLPEEARINILNSKHDDTFGTKKKNPKGATALYAAVRGGHLEIVEALLAAGADVNLPTTQYSKSLLHLAFHMHSRAILLKKSTQKTLDIINLLTENGADHHQLTSLGFGPENFSLVPFLLKKYIKKNPYHFVIQNLLNIFNEENKSHLCPIVAQNWLILFIETFYPDSNVKKGLCNGFALAAEESIHIKNGFLDFNQRLKEMYLITSLAQYFVWEELNKYGPLEGVENDIVEYWNRQVKNKIIEIIQFLTKNIKFAQYEHPLFIQSLTAIKSVPRVSSKELPLTLNSKDRHNDHLAFCEKIIAYQNTKKFITYLEKKDQKKVNKFTQHDRIASTLVGSILLEEQGGIKCAYRFSGILSIDELITFFENLQRMIDSEIDGKKFPHPITIPITAKIKNSAHILTVTYREETKNWIVFDANQMHSFSTPKKLAKGVFTALGAKKFLGIHGGINITPTHFIEAQESGEKKNKIETIKPFLSRLHHQNKPLFEVTKEKLERRSDCNDSLKSLAISNGQVERVKECLNKEKEEENEKSKSFFSRYKSNIQLGLLTGALITSIILLSIFSMGTIPLILGSIALTVGVVAAAGLSSVVISTSLFIAIDKIPEWRKFKNTIQKTKAKAEQMIPLVIKEDELSLEAEFSLNEGQISSTASVLKVRTDDLSKQTVSRQNSSLFKTSDYVERKAPLSNASANERFFSSLHTPVDKTDKTQQVPLSIREKKQKN